LVTDLEALVLKLLARGRERNGRDLVRASDGELKSGTVYVLLGRMADKGLVESRQEKDPSASGLPRRFYKSTEYGRRALAHHAKAPKP
jgi:DNA-binding PadR family transcriptional regulator